MGRQIEDRLGSPVVEALTQRGGFSPGVAARLRLRDGRRAFVKAVSSSPNPDSPTLHRQEARVAAALSASAPSPRFLFIHDDGDWVALGFEDAEGRTPAMPWREDELRLVLSALALMATSLTASPVALASLAEKHDGNFRGWRRLLAAAARGEDDLKRPWELFDAHPVAREANPTRVTAVLGAITGFFIRQSRQPSPPGLPTLRQFQLDQGLPALEWLKRRTGWN